MSQRATDAYLLIYIPLFSADFSRKLLLLCTPQPFQRRNKKEMAFLFKCQAYTDIYDTSFSFT